MIDIKTINNIPFKNDELENLFILQSDMKQFPYN